jgi:cytochrome c peroxidase
VTLAPVETAAMVQLGEALFYDKLLSGNRNVSCATCHHPTAGTGDGLPLSLGEGALGQTTARVATESDQVVARNAPPLFHVGAAGVETMFWDSRVRRDAGGVLTTPEPSLNGGTPARPDMTQQLTSALAAQAMFPVTSSAEMRGDPGENELADAADNLAVWDAIMVRLVGTSNGTVGGVSEYRTLFRAAFPSVDYDLLTFAHAARAIAAFESVTWSRFDTPFDRFLAGDDAALGEAAKRGAALFTGRARCADCHSGPLLSDFRHHSIATPQLGPGAGGEPDDRGRALETGDRRDDYEFRTPPLRNIELTAPYFHAGAFASLEDTIRHYRDPRASLLGYRGEDHLPLAFQGLVDTDAVRNEARLSSVSGIVGNGVRLSPGDVNDLAAFLRALTDPAARTPVAPPAAVPSGLPVAD